MSNHTNVSSILFGSPSILPTNEVQKPISAPNLGKARVKTGGVGKQSPFVIAMREKMEAAIQSI